MAKKARKKRGPWIDITLISSILVLVSLFLLLTNSNELSEIKNSLIQTGNSISTHSVTETDSTFPGIINIFENDVDLNTPYQIHYPETTHEQVNEAIQNYIQQSKQQYLSAAEFLKTNSLDEKVKAHLKIEFETFTYEDTYYSIKFTQKQLLHTEEKTSIKTIVFNRQTGKIVTLSNLFSDDLTNYTTFSTYIRTLILKQPEYKKLIDLNKIKTNFPKNGVTVKHFTIENEHLTIYFDKGIITSEEHGVIAIPVSLSFLNPILAADFQTEMAEQSENILVSRDNKKRVALTFDDGPHPTVTNKILDLLDTYHAKATFFMLGNRIQLYPEVTKEVFARGHEIGNHTWNHPVLTGLSEKQIMQEFNSTEKLIVETIGANSTIFRAPYGISTDAINSIVPRESINWTIDTLDWKHRNADQAISVIKKNMHNNAVILMHDIHMSTADGLTDVLEFLSNEGYEFVTVTELMSYKQ